MNNNSENITDSNIIDFIYYSWYEINKSKQKELIIKAFRDDGITLAIDGSEDKEFLKIPKEYIDDMLIYNNKSNIINENDEEEQEFEGNNEDNKAFFIFNDNQNHNKGQSFDNHQTSILDYFQNNEDNQMDLDDI